MSAANLQAVVIGASAGAVEALLAVLPNVPAHCPFPIIIVVHIPGDRKSNLAEVLQYDAHLVIKEAEDKEPLLPGHAYVAPPDYHLLVEEGRYLSLSNDEAVLYSRPSIDVLFESAADVYGPGLMGIILTGANSDGSKGLKAILAAGGKALVQNPEMAYSPIMPEAAIKACPGAVVMNLAEIATYLQEISAL